ncbi:hypothetical protein Droror1_Dr00028289 [Drosera rotundifolia]
MVTSLCPLRLVHHVDNSSTINLLVWKCMLLWRASSLTRISLGIPTSVPPNSVKSLEHVRFIQDPCQERSQSLLISFMLNYSKRESIHVLHHFLGRYRLSPVRFFLY